MNKVHITVTSVIAFTLGIIAKMAYDKYKAPKVVGGASNFSGWQKDTTVAPSLPSTDFFGATGFNAGATPSNPTFGSTAKSKEKVNRFGVIQNGPRKGLQA